jgi:hypothetical protein
MTTITNLFSNLNDLTKSKSVTDSVSEYKEYKNNSYSSTPGLSQGEKFKKYQKKIKHNLEKSSNNLSGKEGFDGLNLKDMNLSANGLTRESNNIIRKNNFSSQQQTLENLRNQHKNKLNEFETLLAEINGTSAAYINRISKSNPYLGKNVKFSDGNICYVTQQGVAKWYENESIFQSTAGNNGCPSTTNLVQVNIPFAPYSANGSTIPTKPSLITGTPMNKGQTCGNEGSNVYVNSLGNKPVIGYYGCHNTPANGTISTAEQLTFSQCEKLAINSGNSLFGLQKIDSSGVGTCILGNNSLSMQSAGEGFVYSLVPLWASNTASGETSNPGASATVSLSGSLSVLNSSGKTVYNTPSTKATPANYLGCYGDGPNRAIPLINTDGSVSTVWGGNDWSINYAKAFSIATNYQHQYFSIQCANGQGYGQGGFTNNLQQAMSYGPASNCQNVGGYMVGGGWSNAVYSSNGTSHYWLVCQDDGNLCLYRGSGPGDNQGAIWCTMTNGKQKSPNSKYTATSPGSLGSWISVGTTISPGQFIGNSDGSIFLLMQNDGNLVLYTSNQNPGCSTSSLADGNYVGNTSNINSLYGLFNLGDKANYGQVAYIDQNAELHTYPQNNISYDKTYTVISGMDNVGDDIPGAAYGGATVKACETTCSNNPECAGFAYTPQNNVCYPKTTNMYPNGQSLNINPMVDVHIRNKMPSSTPIGVPTTTNNTDSISYQNYPNGGPLQKEYGLSNATSVQKQQLEQIQNQLSLLSSQITNFTNEFGEGAQKAEVQMNKNVQGVGNYLTNLNDTNKKIKGFNTQFERILDESDIVVLQKNYEYLFWTILATGAVLVTMNIVKK